MYSIKEGKKSGLFRKRALAKMAKIHKMLLEQQNQPCPSTSTEARADTEVVPLVTADQSFQDTPSVEDLPLEEDEEEEMPILEDGEYDDDDDGYPITESDEENEDDARHVDEKHNPALHFMNRLRLWGLSHKITHDALDDLLGLIRETTDIQMPANCRTFLKTPKGVGKEISTVAGGQLWYQGIQNSIQHCSPYITIALDAISINLFVGGIPMNNCQPGPTQLWPILMQLYNFPEAPILVVGVYCGSSKPDNVEGFLRPLVTEMNQLMDDGIIINDHSFGVCFNAFIANASARAFISGKIIRRVVYV
uniref:Uncharacterized protein n=1 Tax=Anopheles culicifacies TaxID=139723 RepID=A0A182MMX1_9DIPT